MCDGAWLTGAQEAEHHRRFDKVTQMIRGGMEVIMRAQGLGCDNQRWIEVVTADGKQRCAALTSTATCSGTRAAQAGGSAR